MSTHLPSIGSPPSPTVGQVAPVGRTIIPLAVATTLLLATLACLPSLLSLWELWSDFDAKGNTHGPLVVALSAWLLYRRRHDIAAAEIRPSLLGLLGLCGTALLWLICWRASIRDGHLLLLPAMLFFSVHAAFGWNVSRQCAFPIDFLIFALPVWDWFTPALQHLTLHAQMVMLKISGVPAFFEGTLIHLPAGTFDVEPGCSGRHYFTVGLAFAALIGEMNGDTLRRRAFLLAAMGATAILANWVRVYVVVLAGHLTDMHHYLVTTEHYRFGWVVFAVFAFGFMWFVTRGPLPAVSAPPAPNSSSSIPRSAFLAMVAALAALPLIRLAVELGDASILGRSVSFAMPVGRGGWHGPEASTQTDWQPVYRGASIFERARYMQGPSRMVETLLVSYRVQRQGAELIGYGNSLLGEHGLAATSEGIVESHVGRFREILASDAAGRGSLIWYRYVVGSRPMTSAVESQLWYGVSSLASGSVSTAVAFRAACGTDCDEARATLGRFAEDMSGSLELAAASAGDKQ